MTTTPGVQRSIAEPDNQPIQGGADMATRRYWVSIMGRYSDQTKKTPLLESGDGGVLVVQCAPCPNDPLVLQAACDMAAVAAALVTTGQEFGFWMIAFETDTAARTWLNLDDGTKQKGKTFTKGKVYMEHEGLMDVEI